MGFIFDNLRSFSEVVKQKGLRTNYPSCTDLVRSMFVQDYLEKRNNKGAAMQ